jgi:transposase
VFWIVDGGTIHRGQAARERLESRFPNLTLVHLPKHASWLNQLEIYFSILQRKALTPADFSSQDEVAARILGFQDHSQQIATPFEWKFTRAYLDRLMARWYTSSLAEAA